MAAKKRPAAAKSNPFSEDGVLQSVLDYVGAGHTCS
jgi:hypothetical protein